jgi:hypothetical protein
VLQTGSDALPLSVRDAVRARTRTLSTPARDALEVAALVGSRMQAELLLSLVNDPVIMDELISQDLLIKDGNDLRFRHEIARVAIEAAVPPYRTAAFHSSLFISVRTVEHHVSTILGKLGATTRKGAANEALKLDLTHSDRVSVLGAPKSR